MGVRAVGRETVAGFLPGGDVFDWHGPDSIYTVAHEETKMRNSGTIDISSISDITASVANYQEILSYIKQLDPKQKDTLDAFYDDLLKRHGNLKWIDHTVSATWDSIDLHYVKQMWGSTSAGWGGIGGAAMTETHTLVIENRHNKIIAVYYSGKLAYIAYMDNKLDTLMLHHGYRRLPGITDASRVLNCVYINKNRS
jgi:hypothetical protein